MNDIHRTLGEHSAKLENLEQALAKIDANVEKLLADKNQREGGKKTVYTIATVLGTIGGALASKYFK